MNNGIFSLGIILVLFGFVSDIIDYHDTYAIQIIIVGFVIMIAGAFIPAVTTEVRSRETVVPSRRTKTVVTEE